MNVGIVCYASVGGSGIVATELAKALADGGHQVRLISTEMPFRVPALRVGLAFHAVQTPGYPLFREPQYLLSLANKIVQVSREYQLDIIHAHYAIPHAAAAYLARQILANAPGTKVPLAATHASKAAGDDGGSAGTCNSNQVAELRNISVVSSRRSASGVSKVTGASPRLGTIGPCTTVW